MTQDRRRLDGTPAAVAVGLLAFAASANTLRNGFFLDDFQAILANPWIREPARLGEAFGTHLVGFDPRFRTSYYRPLVHVVYAACYAVSALEPWAYHLASVVLHSLVSVAVYLLLLRWTGDAPRDERSLGDRVIRSPGALVAAAVFAVHPVHCEAVAWAGAVMDVGYAVFFLLALLAAMSRGERPALERILACVLFLGALLFKEPAVMLVPTVLVAFAARGDLSEPRTRRPAVWTLLALSFTLGAYLVIRVQALGGATAGDRRVQLDGMSTVLTAFGLLGAYVEKLVWPAGLSPFHDFQPITAFWNARFVFGLAAAFVLAAFVWRCRRVPEVVLGGALFLLPLLPALHAPSVGEGLLSERYLYLPSAGAAAWLAVGVDRAASRLRSPRLGHAAIGAGLLALTLVTLAQNAVWRDDLTLWTNATRQSPRSAPILERLGFAQLTAGDSASAVASLARALEVDPDRLDARMNLATALSNLGAWGGARLQAEIVLRQRPNHVGAHVLRGWTFAGEGNQPAAVAAYEWALSLDPTRADAHNLAGAAYAQIGQLENARRHFEAALRLEPRNVSYARNLALVRN